ncbi:glutamyl-tRNA(Gln) amidotransferase subunit C, mitochondrial [Achroia grisella]|uniref:glutamyl-tRNA(Gln) amidotransferase subunit C, mitochondrial n=1 Tax=Achroia grisella TaxID=688607 RepID=UPI0027D1F351|nr:glutamyl-tRNA(Gln) amidotransferase subunit C, mitochondrial [Achroia grisella]
MKFKFPSLLSSYSKIKYIQTLSRNFGDKVPIGPVNSLEKCENKKVVIDQNTLGLLERLSLVKCDTADGIKVLEDSIAFANKILHINTDNVQPMYSVLEEENLNLRIDKVTQGNCQKDILKNACVTEDDYFVAPPGNIPLQDIKVKEIKQAQKNEN